eukprot:COSAG01_NODE_5807_length_4021_cov_30.092810_1_plen_208_part_00
MPTTWAGLGVVYAEVRLLFEAARRFPNASHFAFLSESCVPRRSCKDILRMLDSEWSGKSVLQVFRTSEFWASHQNKLLARHHVMSHILRIDNPKQLSEEATLQAVDKRVQQVACQFASGEEVNGFALPKQVDNTGEMCNAQLPEGPECLAFSCLEWAKRRVDQTLEEAPTASRHAAALPLRPSAHVPAAEVGPDLPHSLAHDAGAVG